MQASQYAPTTHQRLPMNPAKRFCAAVRQEDCKPEHSPSSPTETLPNPPRSLLLRPDMSGSIFNPNKYGTLGRYMLTYSATSVARDRICLKPPPGQRKEFFSCQAFFGRQNPCYKKSSTRFTAFRTRQGSSRHLRTDDINVDSTIEKCICTH